MSDDLISRQALLDKLNKWDWQELYLPSHFKELIFDEVPSVQPKQKTGHWEIAIGYDIERTVMCDQCRKMAYEPSNFCPNCGAKMET